MKHLKKHTHKFQLNLLTNNYKHKTISSLINGILNNINNILSTEHIDNSVKKC